MQQRQRVCSHCRGMRSRGGNHRPEGSSSTRQMDALSQTRNEKKETEKFLRDSSDKQPVNHQLLNDYKACLNHHCSLLPQAPTSPHLPTVQALSDFGTKMNQEMMVSASQSLQQSEVASGLRHVCRAVSLLLKQAPKTLFNKCQPPTILQAVSA